MLNGINEDKTFAGGVNLILQSSGNLEVGFFETGFSLYEVSGLYHQGLTTFLNTMPVDPQAKAATTWGALKRQW